MTTAKTSAEEIQDQAFRETVEVADWLWYMRWERQLEGRFETIEMIYLPWRGHFREETCLGFNVPSLSILSVDGKYTQYADI